jgi:hypothetical protein
VFTFAVFEWNLWYLIQGMIGGTIAAALIGFMVPKTLSRRMTETLGGREPAY